MTKILKGILMLALTCTIIGQAQAAEFGTKEEAVALVKRTVEAIKTDGAEKTYAAIVAKDPRFVDRDLYAIVYKMDGHCLAHRNAKLVGRDLSRSVDTDGFAYGKDRVEKAKTMKTFWVDYKYKNPVTKKIQPKTAYCEVANETIICAGAYKTK